MLAPDVCRRDPNQLAILIKAELSHLALAQSIVVHNWISASYEDCTLESRVLAILAAILALASNVVGCESGALAESNDTVEWPFGRNVLAELVEGFSITLSGILFEVLEEFIIRRERVPYFLCKSASVCTRLYGSAHQEPFQLALYPRPSRKCDSPQDRTVEQLFGQFSRTEVLASQILTHQSASRRSVEVIEKDVSHCIVRLWDLRQEPASSSPLHEDYISIRFVFRIHRKKEKHTRGISLWEVRSKKFC
jgi:hypothetical protein